MFIQPFLYYFQLLLKFLAIGFEINAEVSAFLAFTTIKCEPKEIEYFWFLAIFTSKIGFRISEHWNLFITDATGCSKAYMACAFGMEACKQYYNTRHVRLFDLLIDLEIARSEGYYKKVMAKFSNPLVLILDEWLLLKPTESKQRDIFELLHRRRRKSTTTFCSQYEFEDWYDLLGGDASPLEDAIIDPIAHDSYRTNITSMISFFYMYKTKTIYIPTSQSSKP